MDKFGRLLLTQLKSTDFNLVESIYIYISGNIYVYIYTYIVNLYGNKFLFMYPQILDNHNIIFSGNFIDKRTRILTGGNFKKKRKIEAIQAGKDSSLYICIHCMHQFPSYINWMQYIYIHSIPRGLNKKLMKYISVLYKYN